MSVTRRLKGLYSAGKGPAAPEGSGNFLPHVPSRWAW